MGCRCRFSLHGIIHQDYPLIIGYLLSMVSCGFVVGLVLIYKSNNRKIDNLNISLEEIITQLPGHIYWKDKNCVCMGCNTNNWKDFGLKSLDDFKGKTDYDLFEKEEADHHRLVDEEVMRTGKFNHSALEVQRMRFGMNALFDLKVAIMIISLFMVIDIIFNNLIGNIACCSYKIPSPDNDIWLSKQCDRYNRKRCGWLFDNIASLHNSKSIFKLKRRAGSAGFFSQIWDNKNSRRKSNFKW